MVLDFPVSIFISKSPEGKRRKVITHTVIDNQSNPAIAPFIMAGIVGRKDPTGKMVLNGVLKQEQFNILDRTDDDPLLSGIGFDVGEA